MKVGIVFLACGIIAIVAAICLVILGEEVTHSISGVGRMVVGGLTGLWLLNNGIVRIKRARHEDQTR